MKIRPTKGITFDDVLLLPKRSPFKSRQDVSTATCLTPTIPLHIPIVSANMDTVTETRMAIAMAQAGGIGIIHRFMTVSAQAAEVSRVKRAEGFMIEDPYSIDINTTIIEARRVMQRTGVGGLFVLQSDGTCAGLVTRRDVLLVSDNAASIVSVMTPVDRLIKASPGVSHDEAQRLLHDHRLEKLPVVDENGRVAGLITAQDIIKRKETPYATKDDRQRLRVGAAIGVAKGEMDRAEALLAAGADVLVLDIAHGHADHCIDMVRALRNAFPSSQIIAGNVASREGARDLAEAGADAIKVGIGPGSICTTRIVTGFGVPQLTAIIDSVEGVKESGVDIPIIADGGIKTSGDLVKALAAGASSVMIGSMFAGCEEAPGSPVIRDGQKVKVVRGMASLAATMSRKGSEKSDYESAESQEDWAKVVPEGVEAVVPYRGHVHEILHQLVGGLKSGLSYGGAQNIEQLWRNAEFIEITPAGVRESSHHDVKKL